MRKFRARSARATKFLRYRVNGQKGEQLHDRTERPCAAVLGVPRRKRPNDTGRVSGEMRRNAGSYQQDLERQARFAADRNQNQNDH